MLTRMHRRSSPDPDARPALRATVGIHPLDSARSIVTDDDVPVARLANAGVELLRRFDGTRTPAEVASQAAVPVEEVRRLLAAMRSAGLTTDSLRPRRSAGVSYQPPLTLRFASGRARRLFAALAVPSRFFVHPRTVVVGCAVIVAGVAAGFAQSGRITRVLADPLPVSALLAVLAALFVATLLHELAHGMALTGFGGVPRRAGVMLFYLSPAFFVDVTDAWRLRDRRRRAAVALAGPFVHAVLAGAASIAALAAPAAAARVLLAFALAAASIAVFNLIPFVRFDGYLALVALLDRPHLRRDALAAFGRRVFGTATGETPALLLFGAACAVTPSVLTVLALSRVAATLGPLGASGAAAFVLAVTGVAAAVAAAAVRYVRATAPSAARLALVAGVVLGLVSALALTPVANERRLGFVRVGSRLSAVALTEAELADIPQGAPVRLESNGIALHRSLGTARWAGGLLGDGRAPLEALVPSSIPDTTVAVHAAPLANPSRFTPETGVAIVRLGEPRPAVVAFWCQQLAPLFGTPPCHPTSSTKGTP